MTCTTSRPADVRTVGVSTRRRGGAPTTWSWTTSSRSPMAEPTSSTTSNCSATTATHARRAAKTKNERRRRTHPRRSAAGDDVCPATSRYSQRCRWSIRTRSGQAAPCRVVHAEADRSHNGKANPAATGMCCGETADQRSSSKSGRGTPDWRIIDRRASVCSSDASELQTVTDPSGPSFCIATWLPRCRALTTP